MPQDAELEEGSNEPESPDEAADAEAQAEADSEAVGDEPGAAEETVPEPLTPEMEVERWKDHAARSQAELENYRKRMAREKSEAILYANRNLLEQILPILDNFEMGLKAAQEAEGESSMILQGMKMVRKQFEDFLADQGVEVIPSDGEAFDPNVHEAIKQEPSEEVAEGCVIYTVRRGFKLKDRVLRAANVVVSSGPEAGA